MKTSEKLATLIHTPAFAYGVALYLPRLREILGEIQSLETQHSDETETPDSGDSEPNEPKEP